MKLLDQPISKEAAISNKEALVRALIGAGTGALVGGAGEYIMTGDVGWRGPTLGAALGTGTVAAVDPKMREKVRSLLRQAGGDESEKLEDVKADSLGPGARSLAKRYKKAKYILESGMELEPGQREALESVTRSYEAQMKERELWKDPKYQDAMRYAYTGGLFSKLNNQGGAEDVSLATAVYANRFKERMGRDPEEWELRRFADAARGGLSYNDLENYWQGRHEMAGNELYGPGLMALDASSMATGFIPGKDKAFAKGLELANKVPGLRGGFIGGAAKEMRRRATLVAQKKAYDKFLKDMAGIKTTMYTKKQLADKLTERVGREMAEKLIERKGITRGMLKTLKAGTRGNVLAGSVLDLYDLVRDPETGKVSANVLDNIAKSDKLMEIREQYGHRPNFFALMKAIPGLKQTVGKLVPDELASYDAGERTLLDNMAYGALQGAMSRWETLGVAGKRIGDTAGLAAKSLAHQAKWGLDRAPITEAKKHKWLKKGPGAGKRRHYIPGGPSFRISDYYDPIEFHKKMQQGYKPDGRGGWTKGKYYTEE